jgi:hypothetical protein
VVVGDYRWATIDCRGCGREMPHATIRRARREGGFMGLFTLNKSEMVTAEKALPGREKAMLGLQGASAG